MSSSDSDSEISDSFHEESDEEFYQLVSVGCTMIVSSGLNMLIRNLVEHLWQTGYKWVMEVLNGHDRRCQEQFRMEKHVFQELLTILTNGYGFKEGKDVHLIEALAMFLMTLGYGLSNRMIQERFQHLGETISRWFGIILEAICHMASDVIKPNDLEFKSTADKIKNDDRYWPYFKDCIGAIDGTHIPVVVPQDKQIPCIGRKGIATQNVMAVCDFNMCFTFAWAGWEGSAHDTRIFLEAIRRTDLDFPHPPRGKYYLVDAGYPQMRGYLRPYKGERYLLPDFRRGNQPRGKKEIFNHRHSFLRCTIERTFGIWKNRWRILRQMPSFPLQKQVQIVIASMALHNFIRFHSMHDVEFRPYDDDAELLPPSDGIPSRSEEEEENAFHGKEMEMEYERIANLLISQ